MYTAIGICIIICILWGWYSVKMQKVLYKDTTILKYVSVFLVNVIICPISILFAIKRLDEKKL